MWSSEYGQASEWPKEAKVCTMLAVQWVHAFSVVCSSATERPIACMCYRANKCVQASRTVYLTLWVDCLTHFMVLYTAQLNWLHRAWFSFQLCRLCSWIWSALTRLAPKYWSGNWSLMQSLHDRPLCSSACARCEESSSLPGLAAPETSGALVVYHILFRFMVAF